MTAGPTDPPPDPAALARDWITLVHSELAAMATDREAAETFQALLALWAGAAAAWIPEAPRDPAPRPAPAAAAPGAGDAAPAPGGDAALLARIAALERRIAELEGAARPAPAAGARKPRKPRGGVGRKPAPPG
jgi:hypothetical protein